MRTLNLAVISFLLAGNIALAAEQADRLREDKEHVSSWNHFADACLDAHNKIIQTHDDLVKKEKLGGYYNKPEFYREVTYTDKKTGLVKSRVQWETENPDNVHVMELFYHDDKGRVERDYTVAFLPVFRNAPTQTLVALHNYNGDLHSFRSFDASGTTVFERCEGTFKGEDVDISYEDYEIETLRLRPNKGEMATPLYQACFGDLPLKADKYLLPPGAEQLSSN